MSKKVRVRQGGKWPIEGRRRKKKKEIKRAERITTKKETKSQNKDRTENKKRKNKIRDRP